MLNDDLITHVFN